MNLLSYAILVLSITYLLVSLLINLYHFFFRVLDSLSENTKVALGI